MSLVEPSVELPDFDFLSMKVGDVFDFDPGDGAAEKADLAKLDNRNEMSQHFPVDLSERGVIWAMGGNTSEAVAERESSLLQFVPFLDCVATQDFCDRDKVAIYVEDPTAKGFAPMAYLKSGTYYIQDGHHRAVASKLSGNAGMSMNVRRID